LRPAIPVYRALDAEIALQGQDVNVCLVNIPSLNVVDADMMKMLSIAPFVLVAEAWNAKTDLESRFGSYLLKAGFKGNYPHVGADKEGSGGQWRQMVSGARSSGDYRGHRITVVAGGAVLPLDPRRILSGAIPSHFNHDGHAIVR
jgi:hypothetical protein